MRVTIHQPEFLPWAGFFNRIVHADVFIVLDDVGYQKNGFINRNRIQTSQGASWITVPVQGRSPHKLIKDVLIDNTRDWKKSIWSALEQHYQHAPFWKEYSDFIRNAFRKDWERIADLDVHFIREILNILGNKVRLEFSSELSAPGVKTERLVNLCKAVGAKAYLSGPGGKGYMDLARFKEEGIEVRFQEFTYPSHLSVVDVLFNEGPYSTKIIQGNT